MTIGTIKLTPAQQLLVNALLSILGSAVTAGMTAIYQASTQGLNVGVLLNVGLVTFLAFFGKSLYDFVPGHIQQTIQALQDSVEELRLTLHITTATQPVVTPSIQQSPVQPSQSVSPVTIHISGGTTAPTMPTVTVNDTPASLKSTPTLASVSQSVNSASTLVDMGPIAATPIDEEDTEVRPAIKQVL